MQEDGRRPDEAHREDDERPAQGQRHGSARNDGAAPQRGVESGHGRAPDRARQRRQGRVQGRGRPGQGQQHRPRQPARQAHEEQRHEALPHGVGSRAGASHAGGEPTRVDNPQKARRGLVRLWHAAGYSWRGLQAAWQERAFRLEVLLAFVLLPLSFWLGRGWVEVAVLAGSVMLLLIVELLNTAVEAVVDRIGPQWHPLSGRAKDMGSAAVLLATLLMIGIWVAALWQRLGTA